MSVYLARKTTSGTNSSALFLAKKLDGYMPVPISQLDIYGLPQFHEVAYGMYRTQVDAFCYASHTKKTSYASSEAFEDVYLPIYTIPLHKPTMVFSPSVTLSTDQATILLNKLGADASMKNVGKTLEYTVGRPDLGKLSGYIQSANPHYGTGPEFVSPLGLKAYAKAITCIELFLATNVYPAYKDLDGEVPQGAGMAFRVGGEKRKGTGGKKTEFFSFWTDLKDDSSVTKPSISYVHRGFKVPRLDDSDSQSMVVDQDEKKDESKGPWSVFSVAEPEINSSVLFCKPSGQPSSVNFGSPGACPSLPGLVFPYFKGMSRPDSAIIQRILVNHFARLFGEDWQGLRRNIADIRRGVNSLSTTSAGMEIAHIMKGIDLCLQTQTRLYLVFDGGYKGFVLLGGRFAIHDGTQWVLPGDAESVQTELSKMNTHRISLIHLATMLSLLTIHGTTDTVETVHVDHLTSSQKIMDCILKRDIPDDQVKEIDNALHGLIWGKPYVQITPDTFLKFLVAFFQPDSPPPPEEIPMYISSCKAPLGSSLYRHLATFGPDSPSLWNTAGSKIAVIDRKRAGKDGEKQPEPPAEIIILSKPTLVAMKDWEKVLKDATVSFKFKERAKEHRGHVIKETTIKGKIWSALQAGLLSHDLEEDGPSKKKVRTDGGVTKPEDLLALF